MDMVEGMLAIIIVLVFIFWALPIIGYIVAWPFVAWLAKKGDSPSIKNRVK